MNYQGKGSGIENLCLKKKKDAGKRGRSASEKKRRRTTGTQKFYQSWGEEKEAGLVGDREGGCLKKEGE